MPETAENVAEDFNISRSDQDAFAVRSQNAAARAQENGRLALEITPVSIAQRKGEAIVVDKDEHPRATSIEALGKLKAPFRDGGSVTAGNASGVNDGAAALIIASEAAAKRHGLTPIARILGGAAVGVAPRIMGFGPAPATKHLMTRLGLNLDAIGVIELNEAFASQGLATLRALAIADGDARINRNGGAIALGHPLGMSGARITGTAARDETDRHTIWTCNDVHRRRPRHRRCARTRLSCCLFSRNSTPTTRRAPRCSAGPAR